MAEKFKLNQNQGLGQSTPRLQKKQEKLDSQKEFVQTRLGKGVKLDRQERIKDDIKFLGGQQASIEAQKIQDQTTGKDTRSPLEKTLGLRKNQNWIFDVLELFDRPDNALRAATEWLTEGKNPIEGFAKGFSGEAKVEWSDILNIPKEQGALRAGVDIGMTIFMISLSTFLMGAPGLITTFVPGAIGTSIKLSPKLKQTTRALELYSNSVAKATFGLLKVTSNKAFQLLPDVVKLERQKIKILAEIADTIKKTGDLNKMSEEAQEFFKKTISKTDRLQLTSFARERLDKLLKDNESTLAQELGYKTQFEEWWDEGATLNDKTYDEISKMSDAEYKEFFGDERIKEVPFGTEALKKANKRKFLPGADAKAAADINIVVNNESKIFKILEKYYPKELSPINDIIAKLQGLYLAIKTALAKDPFFSRFDKIFRKLRNDAPLIGAKLDQMFDNLTKRIIGAKSWKQEAFTKEFLNLLYEKEKRVVTNLLKQRDLYKSQNLKVPESVMEELTNEIKKVVRNVDYRFARVDLNKRVAEKGKGKTPGVVILTDVAGKSGFKTSALYKDRGLFQELKFTAKPEVLKKNSFFESLQPFIFGRPSAIKVKQLKENFKTIDNLTKEIIEKNSKLQEMVEKRILDPSLQKGDIELKLFNEPTFDEINLNSQVVELMKKREELLNEVPYYITNGLQGGTSVFLKTTTQQKIGNFLDLFLENQNNAFRGWLRSKRNQLFKRFGQGRKEYVFYRDMIDDALERQYPLFHFEPQWGKPDVTIGQQYGVNFNAFRRFGESPSLYEEFYKENKDIIWEAVQSKIDNIKSQFKIKERVEGKNFGEKGPLEEAIDPWNFTPEDVEILMEEFQKGHSPFTLDSENMKQIERLSDIDAKTLKNFSPEEIELAKFFNKSSNISLYFRQEALNRYQQILKFHNMEPFDFAITQDYMKKVVNPEALTGIPQIANKNYIARTGRAIRGVDRKKLQSSIYAMSAYEGDVNQILRKKGIEGWEVDLFGESTFESVLNQLDLFREYASTHVRVQALGLGSTDPFVNQVRQAKLEHQVAQKEWGIVDKASTKAKTSYTQKVKKQKKVEVENTRKINNLNINFKKQFTNFQKTTRNKITSNNKTINNLFRSKRKSYKQWGEIEKRVAKITGRPLYSVTPPKVKDEAIDLLRIEPLKKAGIPESLYKNNEYFTLDRYEKYAKRFFDEGITKSSVYDGNYSFARFKEELKGNLEFLHTQPTYLGAKTDLGYKIVEPQDISKILVKDVDIIKPTKAIMDDFWAKPNAYDYGAFFSKGEIIKYGDDGGVLIAKTDPNISRKLKEEAFFSDNAALQTVEKGLAKELDELALEKQFNLGSSDEFEVLGFQKDGQYLNYKTFKTIPTPKGVEGKQVYGEIKNLLKEVDDFPLPKPVMKTKQYFEAKKSLGDLKRRISTFKTLELKKADQGILPFKTRGDTQKQWIDDTKALEAEITKIEKDATKKITEKSYDVVKPLKQEKKTFSRVQGAYDEGAQAFGKTKSIADLRADKFSKPSATIDDLVTKVEKEIEKPIKKVMKSFEKRMKAYQGLEEQVKSKAVKDFGLETKTQKPVLEEEVPLEAQNKARQDFEQERKSQLLEDADNPKEEAELWELIKDEPTILKNKIPQDVFLKWRYFEDYVTKNNLWKKSHFKIFIEQHLKRTLKLDLLSKYDLDDIHNYAKKLHDLYRGGFLQKFLDKKVKTQPLKLEKIDPKPIEPLEKLDEISEEALQMARQEVMVDFAKKDIGFSSEASSFFPQLDNWIKNDFIKRSSLNKQLKDITSTKLLGSTKEGGFDFKTLIGESKTYKQEKAKLEKFKKQLELLSEKADKTSGLFRQAQGSAKQKLKKTLQAQSKEIVQVNETIKTGEKYIKDLEKSLRAQEKQLKKFFANRSKFKEDVFQDYLTKKVESEAKARKASSKALAEEQKITSIREGLKDNEEIEKLRREIKKRNALQRKRDLWTQRIKENKEDIKRLKVDEKTFEKKLKPEADAEEAYYTAIKERTNLETANQKEAIKKYNKWVKEIKTKEKTLLKQKKVIPFFKGDLEEVRKLEKANQFYKFLNRTDDPEALVEIFAKQKDNPGFAFKDVMDEIFVEKVKKGSQINIEKTKKLVKSRDTLTTKDAIYNKELLEIKQKAKEAKFLKEEAGKQARIAKNQTQKTMEEYEKFYEKGNIPKEKTREYIEEIKSQNPAPLIWKMSPTEFRLYKERYPNILNSPYGRQYVAIDLAGLRRRIEDGLFLNGFASGQVGSKIKKSARTSSTQDALNEIAKWSHDGQVYVHKSIGQELLRVSDPSKVSSAITSFLDSLDKGFIRLWKKITLFGAGAPIRSMITNWERMFVQLGMSPRHFFKYQKRAMIQKHRIKTLIQDLFVNPDKGFFEGLSGISKRFRNNNELFIKYQRDFIKKHMFKRAKAKGIKTGDIKTLYEEYWDYVDAGLLNNTLMREDALIQTRYLTEAMAKVKKVAARPEIIQKADAALSSTLKLYGWTDEVGKIIIFRSIMEDDKLFSSLVNTKPWAELLWKNPSKSNLLKRKEIAGKAANITLFNFSDLSHFERTVLKPYFVFLTWPLKNLQQKIVSFAANNKRWRRIYRLLTSWNENLASIGEQSYNPDRDELPRWAQERQYITLPWKEDGKKGGYIQVSPTLVSATEFAGGAWLGTIHPIVKAFLQGTTGIDLFKKTPITDPTRVGGTLGNLFSPPLRKLGYLKDLGSKLFGGEDSRTIEDILVGNLIKTRDIEAARKRAEEERIRRLLEKRRLTAKQRGLDF